MTESLGNFKRPIEVPKKIFEGILALADSAREEKFFPKKEILPLTNLLCRIYCLPIPKNRILNGTISQETSTATPIDFDFKVNSYTYVAKMYTILIHPKVEDPNPCHYSKIELAFEIDNDYNLFFFKLRYAQFGKEVMFTFHKGRWKMSREHIKWEQVKPEVLELLDKAITQAEQDLSQP